MKKEVIINNVIKFNNDGKTLMSMADEKFDDGDKKGALKLYLECEKKGKFSPSLYSKIADLYTELQMYNESICYWYKFLNSVTKRHYAEAYNGLGGNYYLLGFNDVAAYYFNKQINDKEDCELPFDDYMYEMFYSAKEKEEQKIGIHLVDYDGKRDAEKIEEAKALFEKKPQEAYLIANSIDKNSSQYDEAVITLAAFDMINDNYLDASKKFESILSSEERGDYAYNNLFGCYICLKEYEKAQHIYKIIKKLDNADYVQLVKFFHILRADENNEGAYKFAEYLRNLFSSPDVDYLSGCASLNIGNYDEARHFFLEYYQLTDAWFALYYIKLCEKLKDEEVNKKNEVAEKIIKKNSKNDKIVIDKADFTFTLPYLSLPSLEKEALLYMAMNENQAKRNSEKIYNFVNSCFSINNLQLQGIACQLLFLLNTTKSEKHLKSLLIDPMVDDKIKILIVTLLVEMGNDKLTGMVYGNVYSRIQFENVEFNEQNGDVFTDAYALAFGRLAPYDENQLYKLKISAYNIYYQLVNNGNVRKVSDVVALAGLIAVNAKIIMDRSEASLIEYIGSTSEDVNKINILLNKE